MGQNLLEESQTYLDQKVTQSDALIVAVKERDSLMKEIQLKIATRIVK